MESIAENAIVSLHLVGFSAAFSVLRCVTMKDTALPSAARIALRFLQPT